jgi:formylglycine-generating enzyme required for sulfatase activity
MDQLGDYTIQKQLGAGALGDVYLAEHRFIKRCFSLKVLPSEICEDPLFMRRFEAQISEIALLEHPNIVKIHNVSFAEGRYFIVMDPFVDSLGQTMHLARFLDLKGKSLSEEDWIQMLSQVASALDYAHEAGIVHGSLNLHNILVGSTEQGVQLFLSDFGISRLVGEKIALSRLCRFNVEQFPSRQFLESLAFLSPEQKTLDGEISAKADAYAFGVLTYCILFNKLPEGAFDLPSKVLPAALQNWDFFIHRCLQNNPNGRPQQLQLALKEYLAAPKTSPAVVSLAEVEPKVENVLQMAFELEPADNLKPVLKPQEIIRPEYEQDPSAVFHRETQVSHYTPTKPELQEVEPILSEMMIVPGGAYLRGSTKGARDEMPRHTVHLQSFALDIHPVTNEQFCLFLQVMGGEKDSNNNDIIRLRDSRIKRSGGKLSIESGYAKHPVVGVTWYGAVAYAKWVGKRLPTEAEWEAAASAGRDEMFPTGQDIEKTQANFFSSDTTAVMSYPPNSLGLYDMAGNVYEWCQDWYAYNYYDTSALEPNDPKGPPQGVYRVLRGGCWKSLKEDLRCSHRHRNNPGAVNGTYGFRCATDVSG